MLNKIRFKSILKNNSGLIKNGLWLYTLQIFNTILPLITLPYITRVMGAEKYGFFSYALNLITYLQVVVEYGFNLSASRKIAINVCKENVSKTFTSIIFARLTLYFLSVTILLGFIILSSDNTIQIQCLLILYIMVLGTVLDQTWIFQGIQKMAYITVASVISRIISVILIFIFIKSPDDLLFYCFLYSGVPIFIGILEIMIVFNKLHYSFVIITITDIIKELKDGWYTFTSSFSSRIFSGIGVTILGLVASSTEVGIFSAIQKIPYMLLLIFIPIGQIIYPYLSKEYSIAYNNGKKKTCKIAKLTLSMFVFMVLIITLCSKLLVKIIYGGEYTAFYQIIIPLSFYDLFSILNNFLGIQILVGSGHVKEYSKAFHLGILISVITNVGMGILWKIYGISIAPLISEAALTLLLIREIKVVDKLENGVK